MVVQLLKPDLLETCILRSLPEDVRDWALLTAKLTSLNAQKIVVELLLLDLALLTKTWASLMLKHDPAGLESFIVG